MRNRVMYLLDGNSILLSKDWGDGLYKDGRRVSGVISFLQYVSKVLSEYNDIDYGLLIWDSRDKRKISKFSNYKNYENRTFDNEIKEKLEQISLVNVFMKNLGFNIVKVLGVETDNVIGYVVNRLSRDFSFRVLSFDSDLYQLVCFSDSIVISKKKVNSDNFKDVTGCSNLEEYLLYKCIVGDMSDNIKGVRGVGPKRFFSMLDEKGINYLKKEYRDTIDFYYDMVNLKVDELGSDIIFFERGSLNVDMVRTLLFTYGFSSILKRFYDFVKPFRRLGRRKR